MFWHLCQPQGYEVTVRDFLRGMEEAKLPSRCLSLFGFDLFFGTTPHPVTVNTRIIPFLVGNPYKPSFVTVPGWGGQPNLFSLFLAWDPGMPGFWCSRRHRPCSRWCAPLKRFQTTAYAVSIISSYIFDISWYMDHLAMSEDIWSILWRDFQTLKGKRIDQVDLIGWSRPFRCAFQSPSTSWGLLAYLN